MAKFRASKGYQFSEDGTLKTTWAHFTLVPNEHRSQGEPAVYEFETTDRKAVAQLRKLIDAQTEGYTDITEVEKPKKAPDSPTGDSDTGDTGTGDQGTGDTGSGDQGA
ncbi:hypothetical protein BH11ACT6_BH11ACT6_34880 [soil metagenome]